MKALQQSAHLIGAILLMTAQQAWAAPEGSAAETPINSFATRNHSPGQGFHTTMARVLLPSSPLDDETPEGFRTTMALVLLPSSPLDYTPTPKDAQQPHEPQSFEMDIPGRVLPSNFQRVYATRPDALLASHFLSWDPSQPDGPVTSRNPQTFRFITPVNSRNGDAVTTAPVPFVQETSMTLRPRGPEVDLLLCTIPTSASNLQPFNSAACPIFDGGQRAGAKILPLSMHHLASMVDLQRQMKTGEVLPSGALDIIRTYLRDQKDVRPAILLLDQIVCGKVPATPDDVYQAAWLLARAFHAEADRLSALLVYNSLIELAPFPQDRGLAWVERTGLLIELVVDDRIAESTDWQLGVSQALAALEATPDNMPYRSTVEYMKLIHTNFGAMPGTIFPAYMAFVDNYENVSGARRNVLQAMEFLYRMRPPYAVGSELRKPGEELRFLRRFHRLLPPVGGTPHFPNMPVSSSNMLRRLATLEAARGNSALYQAANSRALALDQAQQALDATWGTTPKELELGRPGHGANGLGTLPRIRLQ